MLLGAEEIRVAHVARSDLGQHLAARGDCLRLERLEVRGGEDLARHDALDQPLHRQRRDQREKALRIDGGIEPAWVGARLESVEGVSHSELDVLDGDAAGSAELDRALSLRDDRAGRVGQLDPPGRARGGLAEDLRVDALEARGDLQGLLVGSGLGRIALGEEGVAPGVDHVPGNPVDLPDGCDPRLHSA